MPVPNLRADVFPSTVTITNASGEKRLIDKVRVLVSMDSIYIFNDQSLLSSPVAPIYEAQLESYTPPISPLKLRGAKALRAASSPARTATATTTTDDPEDQETIEFTRMSSCGCGSRLKSTPLTTLFPDAAPAGLASKNDA